MKLKSVTMGLAALSMMAAPTVASAAEAAAPKPAKVQASGQNEFLGVGGGFVAVFALLAIIAGIIAATRGSSRPNSPG